MKIFTKNFLILLLLTFSITGFTKDQLENIKPVYDTISKNNTYKYIDSTGKNNVSKSSYYKSTYGKISKKTGRPRTKYVRGYYRKNGTYVRGYYRS
jgi:hypothetical protein